MRPFAVTAATQSVVAVGTSFSVELLKDQLHVTLFEGEVAILPEQQAASVHKSNTIPAATASLTAGQELVANLRSGAAKVHPTNVDRAQSWENGRIDFIDIPLATAVERMNRYSETPIVIADAAARQMLINGVFDAADQRSFLVGLTALYPLEYKARNNEIVISKSN
jgi:transmembrane sensor